MKSGSKLAKNTVIYAIGNFGTKILSYVMVLVYSYYITPEELGYYDVVLTTISMIQPLVIFQLNDGVFRFLIESEKEQSKAIIGNSTKFLCLTTLVTEILFAVFCAFVNIQYALWVGLLLALTMFFILFQDIIRGLGLNKEYAFYGVLNSVVMLVMEVVGLMILHLGVEVLIVSKACAYGVCIVTMLGNLCSASGAHVKGSSRANLKILCAARAEYDMLVGSELFRPLYHFVCSGRSVQRHLFNGNKISDDPYHGD